MFAYCGNNPVSRIDSAGCFWETIYEIFVGPIVDTAELVYDLYDESEDLCCDVISVALDVVGYDLTADLLYNASVGNGRAYRARSGSYASDLCKNDAGIRAILNSELSANLSKRNKVVGKVTYEIPLGNGDLGAALHNVTLYYVAKRNGNYWDVNVCVSDTFDFTQFKNPFAEDSFIHGLLWAANDVAHIDWKLGLLQSVDVKIWFSYSMEVQ